MPGAAERRTVHVSLPGGIRFIEHRREGKYLSLEDLLAGIAEVRRGAVETHHETYALDKLREMLVESEAEAK